MVSLQELRRMHMLKDMPEHMLRKLAEIGELKIFSADTVLFKQHEKLDFFYMVVAGQVSLSVEPNSDLTVILSTIQSGYSFGISTFIPGGRSASTATCDEPCELIRFSRERMNDLFIEDKDLAYNFMYRLARVFKAVMDHRTSIFLKALANYPEIQSTFQETEHISPIF